MIHFLTVYYRKIVHYHHRTRENLITSVRLVKSLISKKIMSDVIVENKLNLIHSKYDYWSSCKTYFQMWCTQLWCIQIRKIGSDLRFNSTCHMQEGSKPQVHSYTCNVYIRLLVCRAYKSEIISEANFVEFIDDMPILMLDQIMDRFPFYYHHAMFLL